MTVFTHLREKLAQALLAAPALADGRIYIERDRPIAQEEPDAIVIRLLSADASQKVHDHTDWFVAVSIECNARAASAAAAAERAETLAAQAWQRLFELADPDMERQGVEWQHAAEDTPIAQLAMRVMALVRTPQSSLESTP